MSYRLSFDHPFQKTDQHDLPCKIDPSHDLSGRRKQPFRIFISTVDHIDIVGTRFQDFGDPSKLSALFSHDRKADEISMVIRSLWKRWGGRPGDEHLMVDQRCRLFNGLYAL